MRDAELVSAKIGSKDYREGGDYVGFLLECAVVCSKAEGVVGKGVVREVWCMVFGAIGVVRHTELVGSEVGTKDNGEGRDNVRFLLEGVMVCCKAEGVVGKGVVWEVFVM
jgi:hypothetical protein